MIKSSEILICLVLASSLLISGSAQQIQPCNEANGLYKYIYPPYPAGAQSTVCIPTSDFVSNCPLWQAQVHIPRPYIKVTADQVICKCAQKTDFIAPVTLGSKKCIPSQYLVANCAKYSQSAAGYFTCESCTSPYKITNSGSCAIPTTPGPSVLYCYSYNLNRTCAKCIPGYELSGKSCVLKKPQVLNDPTCQVIDKTGTLCAECKKDYVLAEGKCYQAIEEAKKVDQILGACKTGTQRNSFGKCVPVVTDCGQYDKYGLCLVCKENYTFLDQKADKCVSLSKVADVESCGQNSSQSVIWATDASGCYEVDKNCHKQGISRSGCSFCSQGFFLYEGKCFQIFFQGNN